MYRNR
jgi:hypothetical protein